MREESAKKILKVLTQKWRRKILIRNFLKSASIALLIAAAARFLLGFNFTGSLLTGGLFFLVLFLVWNFLVHFKSTNVEHIARHLDRTVPELEESSALIIKEEASLSVLERMQKIRLIKAMPQLREQELLPGKVLKSAWVLFSLSIFIVVLAMAVTPMDLFNPENEIGDNSVLTFESLIDPTSDALPLKVESVTVQITPPIYTGSPGRKISEFDLEAEEGSVVKWNLRLNQKVKTASLIFSAGDTVRLLSRGLNYTTSRKIWDSGFYYLKLETQNGLAQSSDYYKLKVIEDKAPILAVVTPEPRTLIEPGQSRSISLHVIAGDDYRVTKAEIVATVTKGSGEGVKFREERWQFDHPIKAPKSKYNLHKELDLEKLGMAAGDELYFFVEAWDNRQPEPNRSRSETYFIVVQDTSAAQLSVSAGLTINPIPEYFRSQRQIIIDTEKLIQDRPQISAKAFKRRANNLGIDQKALRLRYGQFLGEEFDSGFATGLAPGLDNAAGFEDDFEEEQEVWGGDRRENEESIVPDELRHEHDYAENATLFSQSIKDQLKAALAEMWDAELQLRTFKPKEALPFEYRALVLLKKVQQESRLYVKRIGYEPSPLKPIEKRLSGDLDKIESRRIQKTIEQAPSFKAVRNALPVLQKLKRGEIGAKFEIDILEQAGQALTQQALEKPGQYLNALKDLRDLITDLGNERKICAACLDSIERALWSILPPQDPLPNASPSTETELSNRYFRKLGERF